MKVYKFRVRDNGFSLQFSRRYKGLTWDLRLRILNWVIGVNGR